jgi:hypothetical protein
MIQRSRYPNLDQLTAGVVTAGTPFKRDVHDESLDEVNLQISESCGYLGCGPKWGFWFVPDVKS